MKLKRYKQNLHVADTGEVYSYMTLVAKIVGKVLLVAERYEKFSVTTTKHYRYVASELGLDIQVVPED